MPTALITGASVGIGAAFAQELAARQMNLVLVSRAEEKLKSLATHLEERYKIQAQVIVQDLTLAEAPLQVYNAVEQRGLTIDLLINNAGFGDYGNFAQRSFDRQAEMVKLNVLALVEMTHLFLAPMQQKGAGEIINLSSISAFQPIPYLAVYSASKAFVLHFSEALWAENRAKGVKILAVCPGPVQTEFFAAADMERNVQLMQSQTYEDPQSVVQKALKALAAGQPSLVTGPWQNHVIANASRFTSREFVLNMLEPRFRPSDSVD
uniref:Short-chain dehydrogenase/reductase SDR n=1 Tax=Cyanothece sp. (strain PCC 7425 / ATCC 29141) TaxID=395961 RepID=B8HSF0_CYAP4